MGAEKTLRYLLVQTWAYTAGKANHTRVEMIHVGSDTCWKCYMLEVGQMCNTDE